jgi:hypothetical protein
MSESVNNTKDSTKDSTKDYIKYINDKLLNIEEKLKRVDNKTTELQRRYSVQLSQMQLIRNRILGGNL